MIDYSKVFALTKSLSVLYIEDYDEIRESTLEILKHYFKIIDTAKDGEEGVAKYYNFFVQTSSYYDLIITDIEMPILNGVSLVDEIKKAHEDQQIIVLSAHDESHYLFDLINLGISQYIKKPIEITLLLDAFYKVGQRLKEPTNAKEINLGDGCIYDCNGNTLSLNSRYIKLTKHENITLEVLINKIEQICTTEEIVLHFSNKNIHITTDNIRFLISKLRKKLPKNSIDTMYAVGYRLASAKQTIEA